MKGNKSLILSIQALTLGLYELLGFFFPGSKAAIAADQQINWNWAGSIEVAPDHPRPGFRKKIRLTLKDEIQSNSEMLNLALLFTCPQAACDSLPEEGLFRAPKPGSSRIINRQEILEKIRKLFPKIDPEIDGAWQIKVNSKSLKLSAKILKEHLNSLVETLNSRFTHSRISLKSLQLSSPPLVGPAEIQISFPDFEQKQGLPERAALRYLSRLRLLKFQIPTQRGGLSTLQGTAIVRFLIERRALLAKRDLKAQQPLSEDFFTPGWVHDPGLKRQYLDRLADPKRYTLKQTLRAGSALLRQHLTKKILVKRGQMISLAFKQPGLEVGMMVRAQESGGKDDVIKVIYPLTKKVLSARVHSASRLILNGGDSR